jgi:hypothetical protein
MHSLIEKFACYTFSQTETFGNPLTGTGTLIGSTIAALLVLLILCLFGQYLWNHALCPLVSVVRPAKSIFQILGVAILLSLLMP